MENQEIQGNEPKSFLQSNTAKIIMVGFLTLFLLIPLLFVQNLIEERSERKNEVDQEIATLWGSDVTFYGPILRIPYQTFENYNVTDTKTGATTIQKRAFTQYAYFFPNELINFSTVKKNESLKRGIFNPIVFTANMKFNGNFTAPNLAKLNIPEANVQWEKAAIVVKTTNLKSNCYLNHSRKTKATTVFWLRPYLIIPIWLRENR